jgi:hypothetical protein
MLNDADVSPAMAAAPRYHWYDSPAPTTSTVNAASSPTAAVASDGCVWMTGTGCSTCSVALLLATDPAEFDTTHVYTFAAAP